MATVHPPRPAPPPPFPLLPPPRADMEMEDDSDSESVAESCPHPDPRRAAATDDSSASSCGGSACCHDEEGMDEDDDGCSSCVEGDECSSYQQHLQEAAADEDRNKEGTGVWWEHLPVARGTTFPLTPLARVQEAEDPKRAAERQEEDRKFWEDCLASGYP